MHLKVHGLGGSRPRGVQTDEVSCYSRSRPGWEQAAYFLVADTVVNPTHMFGHPDVRGSE